MDNQVASIKAVAMFKQAAARRYRDLGVSPATAEVAFNQYMAKVAKAMNPRPQVKVAQQLILRQFKRA